MEGRLEHISDRQQGLHNRPDRRQRIWRSRPPAIAQGLLQIRIRRSGGSAGSYRVSLLWGQEERPEWEALPKIVCSS